MDADASVAGAVLQVIGRLETVDVGKAKQLRAACNRKELASALALWRQPRRGRGLFLAADLIPTETLA